HKDTVKYLAQHEANINARNERNQTPLELATGYKEIAKFLLEYENISKAKYACSQFPTVQRVTSYLTQGDLAEEGEFPWMAALVYVAGLKISFRCGGTIISERYIMTAAHCTSAYPPVLVRLGKVNRADESASNYQIEYYIKNIIRHPNYSMRTYKNDIALLQLRNRILFNDNIRPACLYTDMGDIDNRTKLIVTGWGNTIPGDRDSQSDLLLKIAINTMPLSECNATYLNHFALKNQTAFRDGLDDGQYCAHDPDGQDPFIRDACQGDSGGPLTHIPNNDPNEATIVGIVSFGYSCALELPGIYTRVAHYIPWIVSVVWP
ncbi:serine protease persephone-like, partial [Contarinia nasturtii]|uniref:serine protease persephone-like n=1 Tax=Contarinia nasturtii TaxID=265458 RepID=UPI0012D45562